MRKIIILYNEAGGGHKAAALALREVLLQQQEYDIELLNPYRDFGADIDILKKLIKTPAEDVYNKVVSSRSGAMFSLLIIGFLFKLNLAVFNKKITNEFKKLWLRKQPYAVISVTPFINKYVARSIMQLPEKIPFITLVTDYSECMRGVWLVSGNQNVICPSKRIVRQALKRNISRHHIHRVSGMVVDPKFYLQGVADKNGYRNKLGLEEHLFTALVTFGSHGTKDILQIAKNLCGSEIPLQVIFICGNNQKLQTKLNDLPVDYHKVVLGFVSNMQEYMRAADFMVGKPGGLSISEAAVSGLPMIIKCNIFTLLQERYNAKWVEEHGIGINVRNFASIRQQVAEIYDNLSDYSANFKKLDNNAIFEVPKILANIAST